MTVEIRSTQRTAAWYQVSEFPLGSVQLRERLQRIALADWVRFEGRRAVTVTAVERDGSGHELSVFMEPFRFAGER